MNQNQALTLAQKTHAYWRLSSAYNGQFNMQKPHTVQSALKETAFLTSVTGPQRKLRTVVSALEKEIIVKGGTKRKPKPKSNSKSSNVQGIV